MISARDVFVQLTSGPGLMDSMCNFIIRPPRSSYEMEDLGPDVFRIGDDGTERFMRHDFELENMRGLRFQCSWFKPYPARRVPCVVYCHANCGGRYDGLEALFVLREGFSLFCFDFCGSGMSEGEYISLGFYERQDLVAVIEFLMLKSDEVDGVALWGRSMGAVAAIMYASKDPWIRCIVCDSPFASLRILINDLVEQHGGRTARAMPKMLVRGVVERIRKRIMKRAAFDIDDLDAVKYAKACKVPAFLFHGADDDFVSPSHSELIRDAFDTPCLHQFTPGGHNDERDEDLQEMIGTFLRLYLIDKPQGARELQALQAMERASAAATAATTSAAASSSAASARPSAPEAPAPKHPVPPASYGMRRAATTNPPSRISGTSSSSESTTSSSSTSSSSLASPHHMGYDYGVPPPPVALPESPDVLDIAARQRAFSDMVRGTRPSPASVAGPPAGKEVPSSPSASSQGGPDATPHALTSRPASSTTPMGALGSPLDDMY